MPEQPISSKRPPLTPPPRRQHLRYAGPRYAELHAKTNFSFLEGASHADELAEQAAALGLTALAVTDRNTLAGVVRAHAAAKTLELKLVVGAEIHLVDAPPVVLWTTDRASYGRLARLITHGRRQAPKGQFRLTFDELATYAEGLLCGVLPRVDLEIPPDETSNLPGGRGSRRAVLHSVGSAGASPSRQYRSQSGSVGDHRTLRQKNRPAVR